MIAPATDDAPHGLHATCLLVDNDEASKTHSPFAQTTGIESVAMQPVGDGTCSVSFCIVVVLLNVAAVIDVAACVARNLPAVLFEEH